MSQRINARDAQWWTGDPATTLQNILRYAPGNCLSVYLPLDHNSPWWLPKDGIRITRPTELFSDGWDEANGLRFYADPATPDLWGTQDSMGIGLGCRHIHIHDLTISNNRGMTPIGTGAGIYFTGTPERREEFRDVVGEVVIERVGIMYAGRDGFYSAPPFPQYDPNVPGSGGWGFLITTRMRDSVIFGAARDGIRIAPASTTLDFAMVNVVACGERAAWVKAAINSRFDGVVGENCGDKMPAVPDACDFYFENCEGMDIRVYAETFGKRNVKDCVVLNNVRQSVIRPSAIYDWDKPELVGVRMRDCQRVTVETQATTGLRYSVYDEGRKSTDCTIFEQESPIYISSKSNYVIGSRDRGKK